MKNERIVPHLMFSMDPGDNTGISVWIDGKLKENHFFKLRGKETKYAETYQQEILTGEFTDFLDSWGNLEDIHFVIEGVSLWGGSGKSQASALRGDLFRLAYLVGGYINTFYMLGGLPEHVTIVDVRSWKGNLPTDKLIKIVEQKTNTTPQNEHVACAMGIGLWKLGEL